MTHQRTRLLVAFACCVSALAFAAAASAYFAPGSLPPTWHIHDCTTPCSFPHAVVSFFPKMLTGGDVNAYLADPAECPDATDKMLLGGGRPPNADGGLGPNQPLGTGICETSTTIIHLKRITADQPVPTGFTFLQSNVVDGVTYLTYYELTPHS